MRGWMRVAMMASLVGAAVLSACGGGSSSSSGKANLRLLNASPAYPSLDLQAAGVAVDTGVAYGTVGAYAAVGDTSVATVVNNTGSTTGLSTATRSLTKDVNWTLVTYGSLGALKTALIREDVVAPAAGLTSLMLLNYAPDAGAVDIYLTGSTDTDLTSFTPIATVAAGSGVGYLSVASGTYRLWVTGTGDRTDLRLDKQGLVLGSAQVDSLVITEGAGGMLVNSVLVQQQGTATALTNTMARVRVVSATSDRGSVTVNVAGTPVVSSVASPEIGAYTLVTASTQAPVTASVNGTALAVANQSLAFGGDYTMLVWGSAGAPKFSMIADDNRYPTVSTNAKIRLVNATSGPSNSLTLLADLSPVANNVAQGAGSAYASVLANNQMQLNVSSATVASIYSSGTNGTPVLAKGLYTVFMLGDSGAPVAQVRKDRVN